MYITYSSLSDIMKQKRVCEISISPVSVLEDHDFMRVAVFLQIAS